MTHNEKVIDYLEQKIPELAELAIKQAYWQTLSSGGSVLEIENDALIQTFPDGTKKIVKYIEPFTPVKRGEKLEAK
jgi:hypothetical protein